MLDSDESGPPAEEPRNLAPFAALFEAGLGLIALVLGAWSGVSPGATLDLSARTASERGIAIAWGLAATLPLLFALRIMQRTAWRPLAELRELVDRQIVPWFARSTWWELAILSLAAGFGEEILFRGLLQTAASNWLPAGPLATFVGVGVSSLLFGACHSLNRTYFVLATLMSVYLGALFVLTDDLIAPIITHAVYDLVALWGRRAAVRSQKDEG